MTRRDEEAHIIHMMGDVHVPPYDVLQYRYERSRGIDINIAY